MKIARSPYNWTRNPEFKNFFKEEITLKNFQPWLEKLLAFEPILVTPEDQLENFEKKLLRKSELSSLALIPIVFNGNLVGCLGAGLQKENGVWTEKTMSLLTTSSKVFSQVFYKYDVISKHREE